MITQVVQFSTAVYFWIYYFKYIFFSKYPAVLNWTCVITYIYLHSKKLYFHSISCALCNKWINIYIYIYRERERYIHTILYTIYKDSGRNVDAKKGLFIELKLYNIGQFVRLGLILPYHHTSSTSFVGCPSQNNPKTMILYCKNLTA